MTIALREQTVAPVFGIIEHVMGWRQMSLRGLEQAAGEWSLVALVWNTSSGCMCCARREKAAKVRSKSPAHARQRPSLGS